MLYKLTQARGAGANCIPDPVKDYVFAVQEYDKKKFEKFC